MAKRKMIQKNLLKNSISAYFAAIEIHNKPNISFRYETVTLLMMNAWELLLKAFVKKYVKNKSIFEKDNHTITFDKALTYCNDFINISKPKGFIAAKENLIKIEEYRNSIAHFYNEALEPYIFMLIARCALNYVDFIKEYFLKDIISDEGLFIMPLGFKLPFKPEDFLSKKAVEYITSKESKKFIESILKNIEELKKQGIEDSIVLGFNLYLESVKKATNSDLLAAITSKEEANVNFTKVSKIQISNDTNALQVCLSDEEKFKLYPLLYKIIIDKCKERYIDFSKNKKFHELIVSIRENQIYASMRPSHPASKSKVISYIYSERIFEFLDKHYAKRSEA